VEERERKRGRNEAVEIARGNVRKETRERKKEEREVKKRMRQTRSGVRNKKES